MVLIPCPTVVNPLANFLPNTVVAIAPIESKTPRIPPKPSIKLSIPVSKSSKVFKIPINALSFNKS
jgi:hypothetical protein